MVERMCVLSDVIEREIKKGGLLLEVRIYIYMVFISHSLTPPILGRMGLHSINSCVANGGGKSPQSTLCCVTFLSKEL